MNPRFLSAAAVLFLSAAGQAFADRAADAYMKAIESGEMNAAYRAQSYLEPPTATISTAGTG